MRGILEAAREALGFEVAFVNHLANDEGTARFAGVPVQSQDGTFFGTFCRLSSEQPPPFTGRSLKILQAFADLLAADIERDTGIERARLEKEQRIKAMLASPGPAIHYQPVFTLADMSLAGAEALSRFPAGRELSADRWFKDAAEVGLQVEFELQAISNALAGFESVWKKRKIQLGLNASPATILDDRLWCAFEGYPRDRLVVELTEHDEVSDYAALGKAIARLREQGTKIAVDDVGAGYASMQHVLTLRPEILKLDVGLTRSIDADDLRLALTSSLKHFADQFACRVVAEGVETTAELATLRQLKLQAAQGYLLGRPAPAASLLRRSVAATAVTKAKRARTIRLERKASHI